MTPDRRPPDPRLLLATLARFDAKLTDRNAQELTRRRGPRDGPDWDAELARLNAADFWRTLRNGLN